MYKVRIRFVKDGTAKYISHLDLMQVFRRAFMRIGLELAYSGGYHPHMQMNILLPLSTGFSSECELLDLELAADTCPENLVERLNSALPEGVRCLSIIESSRKAGEIAFARYRVAVEGDVKTDEHKAELKTYADGCDALHQIVDLALLANGMLKGKALADFIARSEKVLLPD